MFKSVAASVAGLWLVSIPLFGLLASLSSAFVAVVTVTLLLALLGGIIIGCQGYSLRLHYSISLLVSAISVLPGVLIVAIPEVQT